MLARRLALFVFACTVALHAGCNAPSTAPRCAVTPPVTTGRLTTDGVRFRDQLNRVVSLRGVNAGSRSKFAPFMPFDFTDGQFDAALAAYLDRAAGWGVDVLRVPFVWAAVEPTRGMDDEVFLKRYDALLDGAWKRGIRTVVDFHQDIYGEFYCGDGFPAWTINSPTPAPHHDCPKWYMSYAQPEIEAAFDAFWAPNSKVQADYVSLWQRLIARHKDRPGVIGFELFNEPSAGSADEVQWESVTLTAFYSKMAAIVNGAAPGALVFVDPPGLNSATHQTHLRKPDGRNLVFAPHYYQPLTIFDGDGRPDLVLPELTDWNKVTLAWNTPAFLGEWGAARDASGSADLVAAHHAAFDTLGMSATQWEYSIAREPWNAEQLDVANPDGTPNPMVAGMLRPHAHAVAGEPLELTYDATTRHFALRYTPAPAATTADNQKIPSITEIVLPTGAYPGGYAVAVQGACFDDSKPNRLYLQANGPAEVTLELTAK